MNLIKAARAGAQFRGRSTAGSVPMPDGAAPWFGQLSPRSNIDYKNEIGNPLTNSIVATCLGWLVDNWTQADETIFRKTMQDGQETEVMEPEHQLLELLKSPNDLYGGALFREAIVQDIKIDGTAFAKVDFDKFGLPIALWWLPTEAMRAEYTAGVEWIRYWEYNSGGRTMRFAPEEVLVWREGIDKATGGRRGFSRFRAAIAEVFGDNEARNTVNTIMRNRAQMGIMATPDGRFMAEAVKGGVDLKELGFNPTTANELETKINAKHTGDGRGNTGVFNIPMSITEFGSVLEHLDSQAIRSLPETRVCGIFGLPPVVVQMLIGLQSSSDKNNIQYAHKMAWMNGLIPLQDRYAAPINEFLLPLSDLNAKTARFDYNRNTVEALQEDATEKSNRVTMQWEKNGITHGEYRTALGHPVDPALKDMYFKDIQAAQAEHQASLATNEQGKKELIARKWRERQRLPT